MISLFLDYKFFFLSYIFYFFYYVFLIPHFSRIFSFLDFLFCHRYKFLDFSFTKPFILNSSFFKLYSFNFGMTRFFFFGFQLLLQLTKSFIVFTVWFYFFHHFFIFFHKIHILSHLFWDYPSYLHTPFVSFLSYQ